jgi:HAMP domain-containing protein
MELRTSFRGKLLLLTILPLAAAQIVTLVAVMRTVEEDVDRRARESLLIGGAVVNDFLISRGEQLRTSVEVLAADFGLKEAAATGDAETIQSVLSNHGRRVGADIAMLLDLDGNGIASSTGATPGHGSELHRLIDSTSEESSAQATAMIDGKTYHTFTVPVRAPVAVAWVVLGFQIDSDLTRRIRALTGLDVSIVSRSDDDPRTIATAGPIAVQTASVPGLIGPDTPLDAIYMTNEAGIDFFTLATPFISTGNSVLVVLQRSLQEAMAPYNEARRGLFLFAGMLLVFVALAAAWFSGTVARPLRDLALAARRMISGNYDTNIAVRTNDEVGELASSFNAMRTAIADREKRISRQALYDSLTDLPNRAKVMQKLIAAIENGRSNNGHVAVLSIMLSRMKPTSKPEKPLPTSGQTSSFSYCRTATSITRRPVRTGSRAFSARASRSIASILRCRRRSAYPDSQTMAKMRRICCVSHRLRGAKLTRIRNA